MRGHSQSLIAPAAGFPRKTETCHFIISKDHTMFATTLPSTAPKTLPKMVPASRKPSPRVSESAPRQDIYTTVTNRIIADLEAGIAPWARPWKSGPNDSAAMPRNAATGRQYSGINVLILWTAAQAMGFTSSRWLTFNQARDAGGNVRKGEKGTAIVYASTFVPEAERAKGDDAKSVAFLKTFTVFNLDQIDGLDALRVNDVPRTECETVAAGEALIAAQGIEIRHGGDSAYYAPAQDIIAIPHHAAFHDHINYYRTAFHELGHATGHKSRLDRRILNEFGSKLYAVEELVAEMTSAFVCASLGIIPTVRHADYIGAWLSVLREDNRAVFRAASAASKAADWLLSQGEG